MKQLERSSPLEARAKLQRWHYVSDSALAIAGVALITSVIAVAHLYPRIPTIAFVYLLLVLALASTRGLYAAILTSLLARELHDSVSQALYAIGLGAHTAREAIASDSEQALASIDYVLALAEAGLAEMRALIFELRPESLEIEGLVAALTKQVAVLRTRYKLNVEADLGEEPDLSMEMKHALYRIAQEALHNIVKHAPAH